MQAGEPTQQKEPTAWPDGAVISVRALTADELWRSKNGIDSIGYRQVSIPEDADEPVKVVYGGGVADDFGGFVCDKELDIFVLA